MAQQDVKPTRSELINLKKKIKLSESGHKLLKMKRDGLILEFFKILNEARNVRTELDAAYEKSTEKINLASAVNGMVAVKSTAFTAKEYPEIQLSGHNIMGVVVPKISSTGVRKPLYERGYGIIKKGRIRTYNLIRRILSFSSRQSCSSAARIAPRDRRESEIFWELRCNRNSTQSVSLRSSGLVCR